ncbi:MAG: DUF2442 domain-containing protein [Bacteroidales bacterium]|nr:DUF2442 domain-containing protein [Bacteroidales bacterium]
MRTIEKIWLTESEIWIRTADGNEACERFADYPRLRDASLEQREAYTVDAFGISWPELDEDLSFDGFFAQKSDSYLYRLFMSHPELNASAVARKLGISQSLFAQYVSGAKKPSAKRMNEIISSMREIGRELANIPEYSPVA